MRRDPQENDGHVLLAVSVAVLLFWTVFWCIFG